MKVLLVCSPGGHLQQMLALEPAWREMDRAWVTLPGADVGYLLADQDVTLGHGPTNRSLRRLIQNIGLAWRVLRRNRPDAILSTGAGLAVPFFAIGKLLRIRLVYVESVTRIETISLSGKLVYLLADSFFVQWPQAAQHRRRAKYSGSVL
jgi:beta-1,4-N-acetylglucosaminyltransferase